MNNQTDGADVKIDEAQDRINELQAQLAAERKRAEEAEANATAAEDVATKQRERAKRAEADRDSLRAQLDEARKEMEPQRRDCAGGHEETVPANTPLRECTRCLHREIDRLGRAIDNARAQTAEAISRAQLDEAERKFKNEVGKVLSLEKEIAAGVRALSASQARLAEAELAIGASRAEILAGQKAQLDLMAREAAHGEQAALWARTLAESNRSRMAAEAREGAMREALKDVRENIAQQCDPWKDAKLRAVLIHIVGQCDQALAALASATEAAPVSRDEPRRLTREHPEECSSLYGGKCTCPAPSVSPAETKPPTLSVAEEKRRWDAHWTRQAAEALPQPAEERREATRLRCAGCGVVCGVQASPGLPFYCSTCPERKP